MERGLTLVLTSPLRRAVETAELLAEACDREVPVESFAALAPGHSYRGVLARLAELGQDEVVALVGHEPDLGKLAGVMLLGAPAALPLKKAGACVISFAGPVSAGTGRLEWFLPPRALRRGAQKPRRVKL
jgi:phosphohistidine phosphatase